MSKNELRSINLKQIRNIIVRDFNKKNRIRNGIIIFFMIFSSLLNIALAWIMQKAINSITDNKDMNDLFMIFVIAVLCIISCIVTQIIYERMKNSYTADFGVFIKERMFEKLLEKNIIEYELHNSGDYNSAFQTDILKLTSSYVIGRWSAIQAFSTCVMGIISMLFMSLRLSFLVLVLQVIPVVITLALGRKLPVYEKKCADLRGVFSSETQDYLKGFRPIKTFSSEATFIKKFMFHNFKLEEAAKKMRNKSFTIDIVNDLSMNVMTIMLFLLGGIEVIKGNVSIGTIIACFELFNMVSAPLSGLTATINLIKTSDGIFERIYNLFYVRSSDRIDSNKSDNKKIVLSNIRQIELNDITFAYDEKKDVLKNINVSFDANKKYAIVGNSGSGKSTLIKLILGYYPNYSGQIAINGNDLKDVDLESLSKEVSLVQQDVFIFNDTISANITMGASFSKEEVDNALKNSGLSVFIEEHGTDYLCGEDGRNLSGGEKQRISIARALLRDSSIILFDEATSSLDNVTTTEIENTINSLEKICIAITHKLDLSVLRKYDQILVFSDGKIVERGKLDDLIEYKGAFFQLYNSSKENT